MQYKKQIFPSLCISARQLIRRAFFAWNLATLDVMMIAYKLINRDV